MTPGILRDRRAQAAAAALLAAGVFLALFGRVVFLGETFIDRDLHAFFRPGRALLVRLVHETPGLPLWNPYSALGQPFAANPNSELFHPLSLLFFALPFEWAWRLQILLPALLGAAAMHVLLGVLGRCRAARLFGAVAWGAGGYVVSTTNVLNVLYAVSLLPAALGLVVRYARDGRRRDLALLAACAVMAGVPARRAEPAPAGTPATAH
jgi:hypothetical protein